MEDEVMGDLMENYAGCHGKRFLELPTSLLLACLSYLPIQDYLQLQCCSKSMIQYLESIDLFYWNSAWENCFIQRINQCDETILSNLMILSNSDLDFNFQNYFEFSKRLIIVHPKLFLRDILELLVSVYPHNLKNLIKNIIHVTSIDRANEGPNNLLRRSSCHIVYKVITERNLIVTGPESYLDTMTICQIHCGCSSDTPCYWSSRPSASDNTMERLTVQLRNKVSLIQGIIVTPYQAYMHPNHPVYSSKTLFVQFILDNTIYFQSDVFHIENLFQEQLFPFPYPVLCLGGVVRICFDGMFQRQTIFDEDNYYMCFSFVALYGIGMSQWNYKIESNKSQICIYDDTLQDEEEFEGIPGTEDEITDYGLMKLLIERNYGMTYNELFKTVE